MNSKKTSTLRRPAPAYPSAGASSPLSMPGVAVPQAGPCKTPRGCELPEAPASHRPASGSLFLHTLKAIAILICVMFVLFGILFYIYLMVTISSSGAGG